MTSFGWKRKAPGKISKAEVFSLDEEPEEEFYHDELEQLKTTSKRQCTRLLEDRETKSRRLKQEGITLADAERFREAISKWEEAALLMPNDATLHEMKAQALLQLYEPFLAIKSAEVAVHINSLWWVAHQTLGRAQTHAGEVKLAVKSFSRAVHLNPGDFELWTEDLLWAKQLQHTLNERVKERACDKTAESKLLQPSDIHQLSIVYARDMDL